MATPVQQLLKEKIERRLESEGQSKMTLLLEELKNKISGIFKNMDLRIVVIENSSKNGDQYLLLEVASKMQVMVPRFGPLDGFKIIFDNKFGLRVYFFSEILGEGTILHIESVTNLHILQKLNRSSACVCLGIMTTQNIDRVLDMTC